MSRIPRTQQELEQSLFVRIRNINDYIKDYENGKAGRIKDIATNLRVLLLDNGQNTALLFKVADSYNLALIVNRDVPPVLGLKSRLTLKEMLSEIGFASTVPTRIEMTNLDLIKNYADQEGAHEDVGLSDDHFRSKGEGILIGGIPPMDRALLGIATATLESSRSLIGEFEEGKT